MKRDDSRASIFRRYYAEEPFIDRFAADPKAAVDVIIPIIHTNELWESNLRSIYREIPVHRLLLGDGGCIDDSLEIAKKFPRVTVLDHRDFKSLGFSIRKLIEAVDTDWFIYLHSDVYLPDGWFDVMKNHQGEFDWFGCPMRHTVMVEYTSQHEARPYAGSQMGRKAAFQDGIERIDDDYVYRQEDFVFSDIVARAGFKEGKIRDTFHYHQSMYRPSQWFDLKIKKVGLEWERKPDEEIRASLMQVKGVIKYLNPSHQLFMWIASEIAFLVERKILSVRELKRWIKATNPEWLPFIKFRYIFIHRLSMQPIIKKVINAIRSIV